DREIALRRQRVGVGGAVVRRIRVVYARRNRRRRGVRQRAARIRRDGAGDRVGRDGVPVEVDRLADRVPAAGRVLAGAASARDVARPAEAADRRRHGVGERGAEDVGGALVRDGDGVRDRRARHRRRAAVGLGDGEIGLRRARVGVGGAVVGGARVVDAGGRGHGRRIDEGGGGGAREGARGRGRWGVTRREGRERRGRGG